MLYVRGIRVAVSTLCAWGLSWVLGIALSMSPALGQNLVVQQVDPAARSIGADVGTNISVMFDLPVDVSTITDETFWAFGRWSGKVVGEFKFSNSNRIVSIVPDRPLSAGESVMVVLSHDIRAMNSDPLRSEGYSYQFWTGAAAADLDFTKIQEMTTRTNQNVRTRSYGGIATDLNGDGFCDITIVNEDTADLRVFLNKADSTGEFHPFIPETFAVNDRASPSEPTDFNHDDLPDICVANIDTATISVLFGEGDGTFAPQVEYRVGAAPRGIAVLDVNGDGHIDIVNTNSGGSGSLSVLLNDGTGAFSDAIFFEGGGAAEWALAAADMNEDGILDLVASATDSGTFLVLTSNGDATFTTTSTQNAGGHIWMLVLGDINGDGHDDVAGVSSFTNKGVVCFGDGQGNLSPRDEYATDPFPLATDLGDLDGDDDLDWVTSSFSGDWWLYTNDGDGKFTFLREFIAPQAASCCLMFDADNDGDLDLGLIDELADVVQIYRNGPPVPAFALTAAGVCPGSIQVGITGGAPDTLVAFALAQGEGSVAIPDHLPCSGTVLGLNATARPVGLRRTDKNGEISLTINVPGRLCGEFLQAIGLADCATTNVVQLP